MWGGYQSHITLNYAFDPPTDAVPGKLTLLGSLSSSELKNFFSTEWHCNRSADPSQITLTTSIGDDERWPQLSLGRAPTDTYMSVQLHRVNLSVDRKLEFRRCNTCKRHICTSDGAVGNASCTLWVTDADSKRLSSGSTARIALIKPKKVKECRGSHKYANVWQCYVWQCA